MPFHPDTLKAMADAFGCEPCWRCGQPATRFRLNRYYCHDHFEEAFLPPPPPVEMGEKKDFRPATSRCYKRGVL